MEGKGVLKQGLFYLLTFTVSEYVSMGDPRGIALRTGPTGVKCFLM